MVLITFLNFVQNRQEIDANNKKLETAVKNNDIQIVKKILQTKKVDMNYSPYLYIACDNNNTELARLLIENGADVNKKNRINRNALHHACDYDNFEIVELLAKKGVVLDEKDVFGFTPLHYACVTLDTPEERITKNIKIVNTLLRNNANPNIKNIRSEYPLHYNCNNTTIAKLLIEHGAETIGVKHLDFTPDIQDLITQKATELTDKLIVLKELTDDIGQLTNQQKFLLIELTAPNKAGDPQMPREALNGKSLVDYMITEKPNLLIVAQGYHGSDLFSKNKEQQTDIQKKMCNFNFTQLTTKNNDIFMFKDKISQGIEFKQKHNTAATKIQALGRGVITRNHLNDGFSNNIKKKAAIHL